MERLFPTHILEQEEFLESQGVRWAFSTRVRKEIGRRDRWECQWEGGCDRSFKDGYMVQAAHYDHDKNNPDYDNPNNGRILCNLHHAKEELERGNEWGAQRILSSGIWNVHKARDEGYNIVPRIEELEEWDGVGIWNVSRF